MAIRIEWDEFEIALLIEACEEILRKGKPKSEVVKTVSSNLRKRAISKNIAIDDVFRNENGIALQMQKMAYLLTHGEKGMPGASKLYAEVAELREENPKKFEEILKRAKEEIEMTDLSQQNIDKKALFAQWLNEHPIKKYTPSAIIDALDVASRYCVSKKVCKDGFWSMQNKAEFNVATSKLLSFRLFRLKYRSAAAKMDKAIPLYKAFLDSYVASREENTAEFEGEALNEPDSMLSTAAANSDDIIRLDFSDIACFLQKLYRQRKDLLGELKDCLSEIAEYCKVLATKGENAIYYLTDLTILEKERVIAWLNVYGQKYDTLKLITVLKKVFPDLASYLAKFRFKNKLLDDYFDAYKYQKVVNHILPSFETVVDEQTTKMDFVTALKPRAAIVEKLDVTNSRAFFLDALGVEYLGFIQEKCSEYGLSADVSCGRCELPSITSQNKEFVATLQSKGCVIADIKDLDDIKHHGEDSFDYEKEKNPIYLIRELEIIDELLKKIQASIFNGSYEKAIIISDHGASRLAVLHETENIWSMATSGEHSGRCCPVNELNSKPNAAIEENGFWVLANYDRFKGGRKANVEVHGGASLEEVAVPIIEITRKQTNIEAFILDSSRVITLAAKEHAAPRIYVGVKSNSIGIMLNGQYYDALATSEPYIYCVDLADYTRKGTYTFEILNGNDILVSRDLPCLKGDQTGR